MFNELLKAKRKWYGKNGDYPSAIKMSASAFKELDNEAKVLKIGTAQSYSGNSVNGMVIYIDNNIDEFQFGYEYQGKFYETPF